MKRRTLIQGAAASVFTAGFTSTTPAAQTPQATPAAGGTRTIEHVFGTIEIPADPQRLVLLGDEFLLADVLELGITPIASSATYASGCVGIDPAATVNLEPFTLFEIDVEWLLSLDADLFVVPAYVFEFVEGLYEQLSQLAPTVALADIYEWQPAFLQVAAMFGKEAEAQDVIDTLLADIETAAIDLALAGQTATVATIYPAAAGVTLWLTESQSATDIIMSLGIELVPAAADYDVDQIGRAEISLEDVQVMQGETLFLLQTSPDLAPDEQETLEEFTANPLWATIPAVQNERVHTLERVGYPGTASGRRRALVDIAAIYAEG